MLFVTISKHVHAAVFEGMTPASRLPLAMKYHDDFELFLINSLWLEISKHYSEKNRYYHTLSHIQNMLHQAKNFENKY